MGVGGQVQQAEGMGWSRRHEERVLAGPGREVGCRSLGYDASEAPHSQEEGGCTLRGEGREQGQVPGRRQTGSRKQRGLGGGRGSGILAKGYRAPISHQAGPFGGISASAGSSEDERDPASDIQSRREPLGRFQAHSAGEKVSIRVEKRRRGRAQGETSSLTRSPSGEWWDSRKV